MSAPRCSRALPGAHEHSQALTSLASERSRALPEIPTPIPTPVSLPHLLILVLPLRLLFLLLYAYSCSYSCIPSPTLAPNPLLQLLLLPLLYLYSYWKLGPRQVAMNQFDSQSWS